MVSPEKSSEVAITTQEMDISCIINEKIHYQKSYDDKKGEDDE